MGDNKVQGEGDTESARHYNKDTKNFVREHTKGGEKIRGDASAASDELTPAEREGRSRANKQELDQDERDAKVMDKLEEKSKKER